MTLGLFVGDRPHWVRADAQEIVSEGEGRALPLGGTERVVAIISGHDVAVHRADLPGLTDKQARAAARLLVAENSITGAERLHVAVGDELPDGSRTIVAIDNGRMAELLAELAGQGIDPVTVVPTPLLVVAPIEGSVRAKVGHEVVMRSRDSAYAEEPALVGLFEGEVETLGEAQTRSAIAHGLAVPEVDLRQGAFALRRRWVLDRGALGQIGRLAAILLALTLAIEVLRLVRLNEAAGMIERRNVERVQAALPAGTIVTKPAFQLEQALTRAVGPGGGFLPLAALITGAVDATPGSELVSLTFDATGAARVTVRGRTPVELAGVQSRLVAAGARVAPGAPSSSATGPVQEWVVRAR